MVESLAQAILSHMVLVGLHRILEAALPVLVVQYVHRPFLVSNSHVFSELQLGPTAVKSLRYQSD